MKKIDETTKILALTECMLIWDYIAEHGCLKHTAIYKLHEAGALHKYDYAGGCPFCEAAKEEYVARNTGSVCSYCIWPGSTPGRCMGSPAYHKYERAKTVGEHQAAGRAMLKFLEEIRI